MDLKPTRHSYYCSSGNYYVDGRRNHGRNDYDTWEDFKADWLNKDLTIDHDYNHCFRFDILPHRNPETDEEIEGKFSLWLYFIIQRKGIYRPVLIKNITQENMEEIELYLKSCWEYIKGQWEEFA